VTFSDGSLNFTTSARGNEYIIRLDERRKLMRIYARQPELNQQASRNEYFVMFENKEENNGILHND
jgi:hypothetical protein